MPFFNEIVLGAMVIVGETGKDTLLFHAMVVLLLHVMFNFALAVKEAVPWMFKEKGAGKADEEESGLEVVSNAEVDNLVDADSELEADIHEERDAA